jgi:uncharacterized membrane protein
MTSPRLGFWRGVVLSATVFGGLAILLAIVPTYSFVATVVAIILSIAGMIVTNWGIRSRKWWLQLAFWEIFILFFMGMAVRAWYALLDQASFWLVLVSAVLLHTVAWTFPWIFPRLSARMAREQLTPTTRVGHFVQVFSMSLVPGIAGLAYLVQRLTQEKGLEGLDTLLIAVIGSVIAIGGPQAISHQYWEKKPWTNQDDASPQRGRT